MKRTHRRLDPHRIEGIGRRLHDHLIASVIGQEAPVNAVVSAYQQRLSGMSPAGEPVANFLLLGPTGTGKSHLVEETAEAIAGSRQVVVTVDCAEFQHSHDVAKLIGAPPGYVGHQETDPLLSQNALDRSLSKRCQMSFVLFDEIEKASDAVWNLLLGILSKARIRTGSGQEVNFEKCLIFMTSNLGATEMEKMLRPPMGLAPGLGMEEIEAKLGSAGAAAARKKFSPEFFNRLDHVLTFQPLSRDDLRQILDLELCKLQDTVFEQLGEKGYMFAVTSAAREQILAEGTDARYGARFLKRAMKRILVKPLSNLVCSQQVVVGDLIKLDWNGSEFEFSHHLRELNPTQMGWAHNLIYAKGIAVPTLRHMKELMETAA